ncbi:MAG: helix-turn-helix domain-containing protein [Cyclobacteriaceae bacterium]
MNPLHLDVWSLLLALGVGQGCVLIVLILTRHNAGQSRFYLSSLLLVLTFVLFEFLMLSSNYYNDLPHLSRVSQPLLFLMGPLFYFYIKHQLGERSSSSFIGLIHFIPFLLIVLYHMPWYLQSASFKVFAIERSLTGGTKAVGIKGFLFALTHISLVIAYVISSRKLLKDRARNLIDNGKFFRKLSFLKNFNITFLIYWLLQICGLIFITVYRQYVYQVDYVLALINSIFIQSLAIFFITKPEIILFETRKKYKQSSLDFTQFKRISHQITNLMNQEIYLDPDLTLEDFSEALETNKNYISQVINQEFGINFNDYLNRFRIEKARELLHNPDKKSLKLLGIALESGFNNKTSFTRAFRKQTGMIPSKFRKSMHH